VVLRELSVGAMAFTIAVHKFLNSNVWIGGVAGAAGRGLGDTITATTGNAGKPIGDGLGGAATGLEDGTKRVARGVENAGQGKDSKHW
jgi:hypothetical protein